MYMCVVQNPKVWQTPVSILYSSFVPESKAVLLFKVVMSKKLIALNKKYGADLFKLEDGPVCKQTPWTCIM